MAYTPAMSKFHDSDSDEAADVWAPEPDSCADCRGLAEENQNCLGPRPSDSKKAEDGPFFLWGLNCWYPAN